MSDTSEPSDVETSDRQDDKDADFNVDDYRHEMDGSDDSFNEFPEGNVDVSLKTLYGKREINKTQNKRKLNAQFIYYIYFRVKNHFFSSTFLVCCCQAMLELGSVIHMHGFYLNCMVSGRN